MYQEPFKNPNPKSNFSYSIFEEAVSLSKIDHGYNQLLKGKTICLVGPSPSLEGRNFGEFIDSHDLVIRLNKGFPQEEGKEKDLGSRTDIHYHCLNTLPYCGGEIPYEQLFQDSVFISCPYPKFVHPFCIDIANFERDNRSRLKYHYIDTDLYLRVTTSLGTRINSGIGTILDILSHEVKSLYVTGFTFFQDGWRKSYKDHVEIFGKEEGERKEKEWLSGQFDGNHIQEPQKHFVKEMYLNDKRLNIDEKMKEILEVE